MLSTYWQYDGMDLIPVYSIFKYALSGLRKVIIKLRVLGHLLVIDWGRIRTNAWSGLKLVVIQMRGCPRLATPCWLLLRQINTQVLVHTMWPSTTDACVRGGDQERVCDDPSVRLDLIFLPRFCRIPSFPSVLWYLPRKCDFLCHGRSKRKQKEFISDCHIHLQHPTAATTAANLATFAVVTSKLPSLARCAAVTAIITVNIIRSSVVAVGASYIVYCLHCLSVTRVGARWCTLVVECCRTMMLIHLHHYCPINVL